MKPEVAVGALIYNSKNEILLITSPKWKGKWVIPGGHLELGENFEHGLRREIKEEVGLDVKDIHMIDVQEHVFRPEVKKDKHFIFVDFACKAASEDVKLDQFEATDYKWIKPSDALKIEINFATTTLLKKIQQQAPLSEFNRLWEIERILRKECPWDRKQTIESIAKDFQDEADEVKEAIEKKDYENLKEEIGDVFQTLFLLLTIAEEEGRFTMRQSLQGIINKMIRRHPHVFGELKGQALTVEQILENWNRIKKEEKTRLT